LGIDPTLNCTPLVEDLISGLIRERQWYFHLYQSFYYWPRRTLRWGASEYFQLTILCSRIESMKSSWLSSIINLMLLFK
jgi:hypothetical protein